MQFLVSTCMLWQLLARPELAQEVIWHAHGCFGPSLKSSQAGNCAKGIGPKLLKIYTMDGYNHHVRGDHVCHILVP